MSSPVTSSPQPVLSRAARPLTRSQSRARGRRSRTLARGSGCTARRCRRFGRRARAPGRRGTPRARGSSYSRRPLRPRAGGGRRGDHRGVRARCRRRTPQARPRSSNGRTPPLSLPPPPRPAGGLRVGARSWRLGAHERTADAIAARGAGAVERAHHVERAGRQGDATAIATLREAGEAAAHRAPASTAHWFAGARAEDAVPARPEQGVSLAGKLAALDSAAFKAVTAEQRNDLVAVRNELRRIHTLAGELLELFNKNKL